MSVPKALALTLGMRERKRFVTAARARVRKARPVGKGERERLLRAGLEAAGLTAKALLASKGSDPRKIAIARVLWRGTIVSMEWIARRLEMKSATNASQQLRRQMPVVQTLPFALQEWMVLSENVA